MLPLRRLLLVTGKCLARGFPVQRILFWRGLLQERWHRREPIQSRLGRHKKTGLSASRRTEKERGEKERKRERGKERKR